MLKKAFFLTLAVAALPFLVALFVKTDYTVEETVVIEQPNVRVFDYVKYLKNQNNYSRWALIDPDMNKTYRGVDGTKGFVSGWQSEHPDVGRGEQEIISLIANTRIDYELRFFAPFEATSPAFMATQAISESQTKVTWGFKGHMDYPMNVMFLFMDIEQTIGDDLHAGLESLKVILEKKS